MSTLNLTRAICHQGCELAMWSVYRHYIVDIMVIGYFGGCARCRASRLLVSQACVVGGSKIYMKDRKKNVNLKLGNSRVND